MRVPTLRLLSTVLWWTIVPLMLCVVGLGNVRAAVEPLELPMGDDTIVQVARHAAHGTSVVVWLPSEHGVQEAHHMVAADLAARGVEVWLADPFAALFLAAGESNLTQIPPEWVGRLVEAAHAATGKDVYLASSDRGAALVLLGTRLWQLAHPQSRALAGALLISPYVQAGTPSVGQPARYLPIAAATNLPLYIVQPALSPAYWRTSALRGALEHGGSPVYTHIVSGVRDRYFFRADAMAPELAAARLLPQVLAGAVRMLQREVRPRVPPPATIAARLSFDGREERTLQAYQGAPMPPALALPDVQGRSHALQDYRGHVVLVNFWASWCPPCVHEIPSLQQLQRTFAGRPFDILAVNMAESATDVRAFMARMDMRMTVLMDSDGHALQAWQVVAFPTSFVVDKQGRVRYALFGAVDWMEADALDKLARLVDE